ncbi:class I SAM-dependent methyltransferase [Streptomyces sp. NPDC005900]|uniref:SAM-dependent methyltransferase n=1 Tax=Streptomyces sp. NPDC005900 TaxID=3154569 RepID=UPI0033E08C4E
MPDLADDLFGPFVGIHALNLPETRLTPPFEGVLGAFYTKLVTQAQDDSAWFAEHTGTGPADTLELCCGGGRSVLELARRGHRVTGVDLSLTQLTAARTMTAAADEETAGRITWLHADVTGLDLGRSYDNIVIGGLSLTLFDGPAREALLQVVRGHLRPGGRLLFDHTPALDQERATERVLSCPVRLRERSGFVLVGSRRDAAARTQYTNMYAELVAPDGHTRRFLTGFRFRLDGPAELAAELAEYGFVLKETERITTGRDDGTDTPFMARDFVVAERVR